MRPSQTQLGCGTYASASCTLSSHPPPVSAPVCIESVGKELQSAHEGDVYETARERGQSQQSCVRENDASVQQLRKVKPSAESHLKQQNSRHFTILNHTSHDTHLCVCPHAPCPAAAEPPPAATPQTGRSALEPQPLHFMQVLHTSPTVVTV